MVPLVFSTRSCRLIFNSFELTVTKDIKSSSALDCANAVSTNWSSATMGKIILSWAGNLANYIEGKEKESSMK